MYKLNKHGKPTGIPLVKIGGYDIDAAVYTENRQWCMLYCGKIEESAPMVCIPYGTKPPNK